VQELKDSTKLNPAHVKLYRDSWAKSSDWKKPQPSVIEELKSWGAKPVETEDEYLRDLQGNLGDWIVNAQRSVEDTMKQIGKLGVSRGLRSDLERINKALDRAVDKLNLSFARLRDEYIARQISETLDDGGN
jgi:hypothetical protein